jgi:Rod binding domain-containing protein
MNINPIASLVLSRDTSNIPAGKKSDPGKLHEAAQQFESLMISEMMKSVRESSSSGWLGSDEDGDAGQTSATEMAETQFATALAKSGGLGLARMIEKSIGEQR